MQSARILVIDDQPRVLEFMVRALEMEGYQPESVSDSREAVKVLQDTTFDLVISDIVMPHLHGLELLDAVKRRNQNSQVLFVTGYPNKEIVREAMSRGAFGIFEKPVETDEFLGAVRQALERPRPRGGNGPRGAA